METLVKYGYNLEICGEYDEMVIFTELSNVVVLSGLNLPVTDP